MEDQQLNDMSPVFQIGKGEAGDRTHAQYDRRGEEERIQKQPQADHKQGTQGQIQVPAEILPQGCFLCCKYCIVNLKVLS